MHNSAWPTPQDYNEAIQNPKLCFADADLCAGKVDLNAIGLPKAASGSFASVYRIVTPKGAWAIRCFLTFRKDQAERYQHVSDFVLFDGLDCTVEFHYIEQGIKVGGRWYPIVKMPWIDGPTLEAYIQANLSDREKLESLANDFYELSMALERAGIAHGDLQHGNFLVNPDGLKLVDYDAFYVPELRGKLSLEFGHPNYQHPLRDDFHFDGIEDLDVFKAAMLESISSLGFVFAMQCVTPSLIQLAETNPKQCSDTAVWMWKQAQQFLDTYVERF